MLEFAGVEIEAKEFDEAEDAVGTRGIEEIFATAVNDVEGDADSDGFTMAETVFAELFEFVRGPMSEIERARGTEFEGIAAGGDVVHVKFGAAIDEAFHRFGIEVAQFESVAFDCFEEIGVADAGDFDSLDVTGAFVALAEGGEEFEIVDDGEGRSKGSDEIFLSERVDAVFDADAGIILAQSGCGNADVTDATMCGRGGKADHVEKGAAANANDVGMSVDVVAVDLGMDFGDVEVGIFGAFAAFENDWRRDEANFFGMSGEVNFDAAGEVGLSGGESFVEDDEDFVTAMLRAVDHDVAEQGIFGIERAFGEMHLVAIIDVNGAFDMRHRHKVERWTEARQFLFRLQRGN